MATSSNQSENQEPSTDSMVTPLNQSTLLRVLRQLLGGNQGPIFPEIWDSFVLQNRANQLVPDARRLLSVSFLRSSFLTRFCSTLPQQLSCSTTMAALYLLPAAPPLPAENRSASVVCILLIMVLARGASCRRSPSNIYGGVKVSAKKVAALAEIVRFSTKRAGEVVAQLIL
ncbi:hypothetical protein HU200_056569 [Digitaria exilis]|uniref:Uncharacterized protein n=1 Tax=Digitaria exilis TaxID=1010633 RepID=A0A835AR78_9POAL|nr:hypothetical protein HU200_056569 [Digitaria exilis]